MAAIRTLIDGEHIVTVATNDLNGFSVRISGTQIEQALATIEIDGGRYDEGNHSTHLIWASDLVVQLNQTVTIQFLEHGDTRYPGKTIDELYPDAPPISESVFDSLPENFETLQLMPKFHDTFRISIESSTGIKVEAQTQPDDHGFGFTVLWNSFHPEKARVSLLSYTLEELKNRQPFNYFIEEKLCFGDDINFKLMP